jgi:hypothetical protein
MLWDRKGEREHAEQVPYLGETSGVSPLTPNVDEAEIPMGATQQHTTRSLSRQCALGTQLVGGGGLYGRWTRLGDKEPITPMWGVGAAGALCGARARVSAPRPARGLGTRSLSSISWLRPGTHSRTKHPACSTLVAAVRSLVIMYHFQRKSVTQWLWQWQTSSGRQCNRAQPQPLGLRRMKKRRGRLSSPSITLRSPTGALSSKSRWCDDNENSADQTWDDDQTKRVARRKSLKLANCQRIECLLCRCRRMGKRSRCDALKSFSTRGI